MEEKKPERQVDQKLAIFFLVAFSLAVAGYIIFEMSMLKDLDPFNFPTVIYNKLADTPGGENKSYVAGKEEIKNFASEEEFKEFLAKANAKSGGGYGGIGITSGRADFDGSDIAVESAVPMSNSLEKSAAGGFAETGSIDRVSGTNVQVAGIDEPDIVKTDGKKIYFSPESQYYWPMRGVDIDWEGMARPGVAVPKEPTGTTNIINAFPPESLGKDAEIKEHGNLLLSKNTLVIFSGNQIFGYDIGNPKEPKEKWKTRLGDNTQIVGTRLYGEEIYLVTRNRIDVYHPCPVKPMTIGETPLVVQCTEIYHPAPNFAADVVYSAVSIDAGSGKAGKSISFVGSSSDSVLYMSKSGIYVTWRYYGDFTKFYHGFLVEKGTGLIPAYVTEKVGKLSEYDISDPAKYTEIQSIMENYGNSLNNDERMRLENEMNNRMIEYAKAHRRELEKTGIIRIGLGDFRVEAAGNAPGHVLNQFAIDEYKGNLRLAVTVGEGWGIFGSMGPTANDVYVLNGELAVVGSIQDLGLTERIYSARFVEDKGYLVTFRQTDPFYVVDLSDPEKPALKGELKIPGYSAYLHPVAKDKILGIGKEDWKVKVSLFDVSLASKPEEVAKYSLDEYWTDVENNHHAFLMDPKNELFFLPGSKGGYVFSYKNNQLELKRALSGIAARRAVYVNDFLYIIGDDKIIVVSAAGMNTVNELPLR